MACLLSLPLNLSTMHRPSIQTFPRLFLKYCPFQLCLTAVSNLFLVILPTFFLLVLISFLCIFLYLIQQLRVFSLEYLQHYKQWSRLWSRDTKGQLHAKMSTTKDRNGMDLTEAEDIQEYTKELYKKDLHDPDNHDGVITHLEPDILECEVKWALGSITMNKANGSDGIPVELLQTWKMMLWKCCTQFASKCENSTVATGLEKVSFHSNSKERQCQRMLKLPHDCTQLTR